MLAQRTARAAYTMAERYSRLMASGPTWRLTEDGSTATWGIVSKLPNTRLRRVLMDYAVTLSCTMASALSPGRAEPLALCFQHQAPSYLERYKALFTCPLRFEQDFNGLVFSRASLDEPRAHADDTVAEMMRECAERLLRESEQGERIEARVRALLRYQVDLADVSLESIARACGLTKRLLRRRLGDEGASFSALVDEARCRAACEALPRRDATIQEISDQLGFSDVSAFFRAFKRWTGQTPNQYRRTMLAPVPRDSGA